MNKAYDDLKDELHLQRSHSLLKTYLLEAHHQTKASPADTTLSLLKKTFQSKKNNRKEPLARVRATHEESLFIVSGSGPKGDFVFYVDTADPRFWLAHAISRSDISGSAIDTALIENPELDSAWMPMELLDYIQTLGTSRGLALDFDRRYMDKPFAKRKSDPQAQNLSQPRLVRETTPVSPGSHFEYVKMQLWGLGTNRILDALRKANLTNSTTISKVRLRTESEVDPDVFSLADIKYDGKMTGRGSSFAMYNGLLSEILNRYAATVRSAEEKFRIHWRAESGSGKMFGQPFYIRLGEEGVSNLEHFCARLFSGAEPFKLMGIPIRRNSEYYTVSAIDLHVNQRVDFELSRKTLSVFLPEHSCGNSLLRLYTNLQHFFSSDVEAIDGSGERVFTFQ